MNIGGRLSGAIPGQAVRPGSFWLASAGARNRQSAIDNQQFSI
jgi:hypothetical protein